MRAQPNAGTQLTGEQTENGEGRRDGGAERCGSEMRGSEDNGGVERQFQEAQDGRYPRSRDGWHRRC